MFVVTVTNSLQHYAQPVYHSIMLVEHIITNHPVAALKYLLNMKYWFNILWIKLITTSSATADEPHDALRQLNYYGHFLTELLTNSSASAEEPREHSQLKLCKMLHKCSTDCIRKRLQAVNDLQGHSTSLPLLPFDRPSTISY